MRQNRRLLHSTVVSVMLLALETDSFAALDCTRAKSSTEQAVCASIDLRQQDQRLSLLYHRLLGVSPQQRATLRSTQLSWLKIRDQCGADAGCISNRYQSRIADLDARLVDLLAYRPDTQDMAALQDLRALVEAERQHEPAFSLDKVIEHLQIKTGVTRFGNVNGGALDRAKFPVARPKGVTPDEWKALLASDIDGGGENGTASYTLVDLDNDGQRDLVVDTYSGGTGLWSFTSVLRRRGNRFEGNYASDGDNDVASVEDNDTGQSPLYSINGRGANQSAEWIRLRDRPYVAYRDSHYGEDNVYLLRPFTVIGEVPRLTIRYRYRLSVPVVQQKNNGRTTTMLNDKLHTALTQALRSVDDKTARDAGSTKPICPIPASVQGDDRVEYFSYGPGHYTFEIVGDMPIHVGDECYIGRVVDWFGGYGKNGLEAQILMRKPQYDGSDSEQTFTVKGVRTTIGTSASLAKMEVNSGT